MNLNLQKKVCKMNLYRTINNSNASVKSESNVPTKQEDYSQNTHIIDLQNMEKLELKNMENLLLKKSLAISNENFNNLKYELEGKPTKEAKSFELKNDKIKIIVESQDRFDFNDEAIVHINAIKDIFREKFENRNKGFYNLLESILIKNAKGEYDVKILTKARKQVRELGDDKLIEEFDKLNDCLIVVGSTKYVRVYTLDEKNKWKDISLNFSSL